MTPFSIGTVLGTVANPRCVRVRHTMDHDDNREPFEHRHFTVSELATMWRLSNEFVRQLVEAEPGVTEWVRQRPGARRYRVFRVPQSVAERLYTRALSRAVRQAERFRTKTRRHGSSTS